ncbi:MAG: heparinase II/III domain-containing protein [Promethearchaeota archaeon]
MNLKKGPITRLIFSCILIFMSIFSIFGFVYWNNNNFPNNHGFDRTILYIRPTNSTQNPGYFVIIDEFQPGDDIEFVFHSYNNLTIDRQDNTVTFINDDAEMKMTFLSTDVSISNFTGGVYWTYPSKQDPDWVPYIKVHPTTSSSCRLVTIITFKNSSIAHPNITIENDGTTQMHVRVGETDHLLFPATHLKEAVMSGNNVTIDGSGCVYRTDASGNIQWLLFRKARSARVNDNVLYSGEPVSEFKDFIGNENLEIETKGQGDPAPVVQSDPFNSNKEQYLNSLNHPFLLFNQTNLENLRAKCNGTINGPWKAWYDSLGSSAVQDLAFKGIIENDIDFITTATQKMLDIDSTFPDWYDTQFITQSTRLYPYLIAYDFIYNNISSTNRSIIESNFKEKILHIWDALAAGTLPSNNHIVVASAAVGIGGILFKNTSWIQITQDQNDFYLEKRIRPNGPCYEGAVYGRYTFDQAVKFYLALKNVGGYNYFTNPRFLKFLNYTVSSVTPLGWTPVFEDCAVKQHLGNIASISICPVNDSSPELAKELRWYAEFVNTNWNLSSDIYKIISYEDDITPMVPNLGLNPGFTYFDSGISCIRSGWERNSTYLVLSNKNFQQSHVHFDENSFEIYALGKKFLTNPGYPHWAEPGHDYTISTEASNTAIINGQGQLSPLSDGFSSCIQNEVIDFIESPCHEAYKSVLHLDNNANAIILISEISGLFAIAGIASLILFLKPVHVASHQKINNAEDQNEPSMGNEDEIKRSSQPKLKDVFNFSMQRLKDYPFHSFRISTITFLVIISIPAILSTIFTTDLINYTAYQIDYIHMDPSLRQDLHDIEPIVSIAGYILPTLITMLIMVIFLGMVDVILKISCKNAKIKRIKFREIIGVTRKYWLLQVPVFIITIFGNVLHVYPLFFNLLLKAQVDAGNIAWIEKYLLDLFTTLTIYISILCAASIPFHALGARILDGFADQKSSDKSAKRSLKYNFFILIMIFIAILLSLYYTLQISSFTFMSTITVEQSPFG